MVRRPPGRAQRPQRAGAETAAYAVHAQLGGVTAVAGTAIAAIPNPISASPPAVPRPPRAGRRSRRAQQVPAATQSATTSQPAVAGPCTPHLLAVIREPRTVSPDHEPHAMSREP